MHDSSSTTLGTLKRRASSLAGSVKSLLNKRLKNRQDSEGSENSQVIESKSEDETSALAAATTQLRDLFKAYSVIVYDTSGDDDSLSSGAADSGEERISNPDQPASLIEDLGAALSGLKISSNVAHTWSTTSSEVKRPRGTDIQLDLYKPDPTEYRDMLTAVATNIVRLTDISSLSTTKRQKIQEQTVEGDTDTVKIFVSCFPEECGESHATLPTSSLEGDDEEEKESFEDQQWLKVYDLLESLGTLPEPFLGSELNKALERLSGLSGKNLSAVTTFLSEKHGKDEAKEPLA